MRRSLVALLLCAGLVSMLGCELRGRLFNIELPMDAGVDPRDVGDRVVPVGLHDVTDLVTSLEIGDPVAPDGPPWIDVRSIDGAPNALKIDWMGGACAGGIRMVFEPDGDQHFELALEELKSFGGMVGCPGVGIYRSVVLRLSEPVPPESVRLHYTLS